MLCERTIAGFSHHALRRLVVLALVILVGLGLAVAPTARADFGFEDLGLTFSNEDGSPATQAGSHPFSWTTAIDFDTALEPGQELEALKDLRIQLPPGLVGTPALLPRCSHADFFAGACPAAASVGVVELDTDSSETVGKSFTLYNLIPPRGSAAELGFTAVALPVTIEVAIAPDPPHNLVASLTNIPQVAAIFGTVLTVRGVPGDTPFLALPRSCGPLVAGFEADSWQNPGAWVKSSSVLTPGTTGCAKLRFDPTISVQPTTAFAQGPSGLDLSLDAPDDGLASPIGSAHADIGKAVLTLPEGMTVNASVAEGLGACTPAAYARETLESAPGTGCPDTSKIGTARVESPLLEEPVDGTLFVAQPDDPATTGSAAENPFDSLLAIYVVFRDPGLGVLLKQAIEVEPDATTGRLTATIDDIPQLPFSHFELHLREGARSPLTTPPACGTHSASYELTPSSGGAPLHGQSSFGLDRDCAAPRFAPAVAAGTVTPRAGTASPFVLSLTRDDGEQNLSTLALALPAGLTADFGAVPLCPETLAGRGACPPASRVGFARVAAGTGAIPAWIPRPADPPNPVYLAGPYRGAPFSLAVVVPARAGPFDLGTVVTRAAIFIDRRTAQAKIRLDPLPQILEGIPVAYRTVRVVLDRPGFVRNPTSCAVSAFQAGVTSATGTVAAATDRFQARDCAALGFKPKASVRLLGPTHRGAHPRLRTVLTPRRGDANIERVAVTLPGTELLDSRQIGAICTRAQFAAGRCPAASVYGRAKAWSPILGRPLEGPLYLRESKARLPGLAVALDGQVRLDLTGRVDSVHGRLRTTIAPLPDLPLRRVVLTLKSGKRGLLVNTGGLCARERRAAASFIAQSGKRHYAGPVVKTDCRQEVTVPECRRCAKPGPTSGSTTSMRRSTVASSGWSSASTRWNSASTRLTSGSNALTSGSNGSTRSSNALTKSSNACIGC
jgi:hypothetical protein